MVRGRLIGVSSDEVRIAVAPGAISRQWLGCGCRLTLVLVEEESDEEEAKPAAAAHPARLAPGV